MATPITVVIPTAGRSDLLGRTLASLSACERAPGYQGAIIVENGPPGGAEEAVAALGPEVGARYRHVERANKSHALNEVLSRAGEGLLVLFDDDVRLDPGVIAAYARAAEEAGPGHFFGGPMGVDYEEPPPDWLKRYLPPSGVGWEVHGKHSESFMGCNWAAFASDLRRVGGFSTAIGPGTHAVGQEHEMQSRLVRAGIRGRYVADAKVWHWVPRDRCSPEWALERARKMARRNAVLERSNGSAKPVRSAAKWAGYWGVYRMRQALSLDPIERFETRYYRALCEGHLEGLLQSSRKG